MRAGALRHMVEIQVRATAHEPTYGGQVSTWTTIGRTYAGIRPLSGAEIVAAEALQVKRTHEIELRFFASLTAAHRIKYGTRIFDIEAPLDDEERGRTLKVMACEGLTQG